jgi:hypothetical protein
MNIILCLSEANGEAVSLFITQYLNLPKPVNCDISELQKLYANLAPAVVITDMDIMSNEENDKKITEATSKKDIDSRTIILPQRPFVSIKQETISVHDKEIAEKFEQALEYCFEPRIITHLLCLVGISFAEFHKNEKMDKDQPMIGIKRIRKEEVRPGRWYMIIDMKMNKSLRRLYPSGKKNHFRMEVDKFLTPHEYWHYPVHVEISFNEIQVVFYITHQSISF